MASLDRGGWSLHYEVAGEDSEHDKRPPVLLIQGCGVAGEGWRPQLDALARDHRVAFFDHRGIGKSELGGPVTIADMTNDARAVLDVLGWSSAHVVGHSMGGIVAQQLAPAALLATSDRDAMAAEVGGVFGRDLADHPGIAAASARPCTGGAMRSSVALTTSVEIEDAAHGVTIQKADAITALLREHVAAADQRRRSA